MAPAARTASGRPSQPYASSDATPKWPSSVSVAHSRSNASASSGVTRVSVGETVGSCRSGTSSSDGASRTSSTSRWAIGNWLTANSLVVIST